VKLQELIEICLEEPKSQLVVELPNGNRLTTQEYRIDLNGRGEPIIIILTGKKI